jgi:hypothetical protein
MSEAEQECRGCYIFELGYEYINTTTRLQVRCPLSRALMTMGMNQNSPNAIKNAIIFS